MRRASIAIVWFACAWSPAQGGSPELDRLYTALANCYAHNAQLLEPHQDNMLDLAELLFLTTCYEEREAYFIFQNERGLTQIGADRVRNLAREKVISARATRLNIELE